MSVDKRSGSKIPSFVDNSKNAGIKRDAGPFIGIVKNNADPIRSGRLQVFIPDFGGIETEQSHWVTVSYASPYAGAARRPNMLGGPGKPAKSTDNEYSQVNHYYGMWFTPPDIGNQVIVTFIAGDTNQGYWFACIMPDLSHYAMPSQAGSEYIEAPNDTELAKALTNPPYPCVEFNEDNKTLQNKWTNFLEIPKPVHEHQVKILLKQGLEDDKVRGVISSSSQRESPSRVFGISTPGVDGPYQDPITSQVGYRKGGHSFVMDDGTPMDDTTSDKKGKDQLIRLRTAGGHQLLMNDTENVMYIGNSTGSVWMEFTGDGKIHVFSESDCSLRTKGNVNIHSDKSINMFAKDEIKMFAGTSIQEESELISLKATKELKEYGGKVNIKSASQWNVIAGTEATIGSGTQIVYASGMIYLNTMPATDVVTQPSIPIVDHPEPTPPVSPALKWTHKGGKFSSTIPWEGDTKVINKQGNTPLPTHEPYIHHRTAIVGTVTKTPGGAVQTGSGGTLVDSSGAAVTSGGDSQAGPSGASGQGVKNPASAGDVVKQPLSNTAIGILSIKDMTALKAQLGHSESGMDYTKQNSIGYIGKYQFGVQALETYGYIIRGTWATYGKNTAVNDPANWIGTDGITSKEAFFGAPDIQEQLMDRNLKSNYSTLISKGVITADSTAEDVAGKLAVAHLLGAGGCNKWCSGAGGADAYGTTGGMYYNAGRYAIASLSPQVKPPTETV